MTIIKSNFLNLLVNRTKRKLIIPFYHAVSDDKLHFTDGLYQPRSIKNFENDLDVLLKHYQPISLGQLLEISKNKERANKNYFHLTFDDGLANFYHIVAPILKRRGIPATVFLNTDFVDNKVLFYRYKASLLNQFYINSGHNIREKFENFFKSKTEKDIREMLFEVKFEQREILDELARIVNYDFQQYLKSEKPYLTKIQIRGLISQGFTFGSHSMNHPYYSQLSLEEQLAQTEKSMQWIKDEFDIDYAVFAFPFTDYGVSSAFFNQVFSDNIIDLSFGTAGIKKENQVNHLQRLDFEIANKKLELYLIKNYLSYMIKFCFNRHKVKR